MTKRLIIAIICSFITLNTFALQSGKITATLIDSLSNESIAGAVIELTPVKNTADKKYATSVYKGKIDMSAPYGAYTMKISFLGYTDIVRHIKINQSTVALGKLLMQQTSQKIDDVVLEVQSMRTSQKGDTLIYNANAFKVAKDADAEGLISKMPGITVIDGTVEAQGETVKKVFVDGKEFFGQDVSSAIKNLPAEVIEKIEVYNKLSDQAEFTGIDDGEGYKAINIVTATNKRTGQFGKIYAGYGFNDKYIGGGNINVFSENHRFSFIGLANNMNQQNFSTEDILGVMGGGSSRGLSSRGGGHMRGGGGAGNFMVSPQSGISTVASFGVNYSGTWGKKVEVTGSYFFNTTKNNNQDSVARQYFSSSDLTRLYNSTSESNTRNYNHRLNAKIDYKINDANSLMIRPSISLQNNGSDSYNFGENTQSGSTESFLNSIRNIRDSKNTGYNISNTILYRARLSKTGRTITADASVNFTRNNRNNFSDYNTFIEQQATIPDSTLTQRVYNNSDGYRLEGSLIYTEPLTQRSQLSMQYRVSYRYSDADKKSYLIDEGVMNPFYDPTLSNTYNSGYITHRVGPGYRYGNDKKDMLSANIFYQYSTLTGNQELPQKSDLRKSFDNIVYSVMANKAFSTSSSIRLRARSSTSNPSITQLQNVIDFTNLQNVSAGNPNLRPTYSHEMFAHYIKSSVTKGQTFMFMLGGGMSQNYIADSTVMLLTADDTFELPNGMMLDKFGQYTAPINMNGKWDVRTMASFGTPLKFMKSNINLNAGVMYSKSPSIINGQKNISSGFYYNAGAVLGSNISEKIDFTLSYNFGYNVSKYSIKMRNSQDNTYVNQAASARFKWVTWKGFTLSGNATYTQYRGITDSFTEEYILCNLYIGKKLFRNQRGEITFGVNDLLNQNTSFTRNIRETYIENVTSNVIGRYFGLQFIYNLRNFGKAKTSNNESLRDERPSGRPTMHGVMPMGMPGSGGHGR